VTTSGQATTNPYCQALGIRVPRLETARQRPDANFYSLLIVALLERGEPLTLAEVAGRFEEAGVAPAARALASLKRCKPARAPVYRDGDRYALDPHDDELDLWVFRLGLRPPRVPALTVVRPAPPPLPAPDEPLAVTELDEAWRDGVPSGWSAQRAAICLLDAHRTAMERARLEQPLGAGPPPLGPDGGDRLAILARRRRRPAARPGRGAAGTARRA